MDAEAVQSRESILDAEGAWSRESILDAEAVQSRECIVQPQGQQQYAEAVSSQPAKGQRTGSLLAEHAEVCLANDKGEEEVDADSDGLPHGSGLNVVEL